MREKEGHMAAMFEPPAIASTLSFTPDSQAQHPASARHCKAGTEAGGEAGRESAAIPGKT